MKLITRNTEVGDLPACLRLVEAGYLGQEGRRLDKADLLRLWKHVLQHALARSAVVEVVEDAQGAGVAQSSSYPTRSGSVRANRRLRVDGVRK